MFFNEKFVFLTTFLFGFFTVIVCRYLCNYFMWQSFKTFLLLISALTDWNPRARIKLVCFALRATATHTKQTNGNVFLECCWLAPCLRACFDHFVRCSAASLLLLLLLLLPLLLPTAVVNLLIFQLFAFLAIRTSFPIFVFKYFCCFSFQLAFPIWICYWIH